MHKSLLRRPAIFLVLLCSLIARADAFSRDMGDVPIEPATAPPSVDGKTDGWDLSQGKLLKLTRGNAFSKYYARVFGQYDEQALYLLIQWNNANPMTNRSDPDKAQAGRDGGDCLEVHIQGNRLMDLQGWYCKAIRSGGLRIGYGADGNDDVQMGRSIDGIQQGFSILPDGTGYIQELKIDWRLLTRSGKRPADRAQLRMGFDLHWDGLDPMAGYRIWSAAGQKTMGAFDTARWGAGISVDVSNALSAPAGESTPSLPGAVGLLETPGNFAPPPPDAAASYHSHISVVPAPAEVKMTGHLEGWDTSRKFNIDYEPVLFHNRYHATICMMYDAGGLYTGIDWKTVSPQLNTNQPDLFTWGFDGGDALQLRLAVPDKRSVFDAWYCTPVKQPGLRQAVNRPSDGKLITNPANLFQAGAKEVFATTAGGYTQEIFIPWSLITPDGKPLGAGDQIHVGTDFIWSGLEGNQLGYLLTGKIISESGVVTIPAKSERREFVTVVIDDQQGHRVRNLVVSAQRSPGQPVAEWDGRDDDGKVVPAGDYQFHVLSHTGIGWDYKMTFDGPGQPAWYTEDGTGGWGGDTTAPQGVAASGDQVFLAWPAAEKGSGIIGVDLNGQRKWGLWGDPSSAHAGAVCLAVDDNFVYYAADHLTDDHSERKGDMVASCICAFDKKTGLSASFTKGTGPLELLRWNRIQMAKHAWWWEMEKTGFTPEGWGMHREVTEDPFKGCGANVMGAAVKAGRIYISFYQYNKIIILDSSNGKQIGEYPVVKPCELAFDSTGRLLVVSQQSILAMDVTTGKTVPVITSGLQAPVGICLDAQQNIYVSDWGKAMCVRVYSPQGTLLRTIGKVGGRPDVGKFDPDGMLLPRQIAVDKNNHLWVMEDDGLPRRVSVWDASSGKLFKEFIGGARSGEVQQETFIFPNDKNRAISYLNEYALDWEHKTYRCISTLWRREALDAQFSIFAHTGGGPYHLIQSHGRTFIMSSANGYGQEVVISEYKDGRVYPLSAVGSVTRPPDGHIIDETEARHYPFPSWMVNYYPPAFDAARTGRNFAWCDRNGDGLVDAGEVQLVDEKLKQPAFSGGWSPTVDDNLSIYYGAGGGGGATNRIYRLDVQGWTASGAPIYDVDKAVLVVADAAPFATLAVDADGRIFTAINAENYAYHWVNRKPQMVCYSAKGEQLWAYPIADGPDTGLVNGNTITGPVNLPSNMGQMIGLGVYHGHRIPLMTTDGLYIASILRDEASAASSGPDVVMGESNQPMCQTSDGKIYVFNGNGERNILEVTGLDTIRRTQGTVTLSSDAVARANAMEPAPADASVKQVKEIHVAQAAAPISIDGDITKWPAGDAIHIGSDRAAVHAQAWLAVDQANLYAAWHVTKPRGFANTGEWTRLFVSGDCTEIQLGSAGSHKTAAPGDIRILFSKYQDSPIAVLYRVTDPGHAVNPVRYSSGNGAVILDVRQLTSAKVVIRNVADGYVLEASVPLADLGLDLKPAMQSAGDLGVVVADGTGRNRADRIRVFNHEAFFPDLPSEAKLQPETWGKIIFP